MRQLEIEHALSKKLGRFDSSLIVGVFTRLSRKLHNLGDTGIHIKTEQPVKILPLKAEEPVRILPRTIPESLAHYRDTVRVHVEDFEKLANPEIPKDLN